MDDLRASNFTPEQRRDIVLTMLQGNVSVAELCRQYQITPPTLYRWKEQFLDGGIKAFQGQSGTQREQQLERENTKLKQMIGDYALANYALKKVQEGKRLGGRP